MLSWLKFCVQIDTDVLRVPKCRNCHFCQNSRWRQFMPFCEKEVDNDDISGAVATSISKLPSAVSLTVQDKLIEM